MGGGGHPGSTVHVEPDISTGPDAGRAGVQSEAGLHRNRLGPESIVECLLYLDRGADGLESILEDAEQPLSFQIDNRPFMTQGGVGDYLVVAGEDIGVPGS